MPPTPRQDCSGRSSRDYPLDERDLPVSPPLFELLLALNGLVGAVVGLDVDEAIDAVLFHELGSATKPVLIHALGEIARYADVERSMWTAREDVDPVVMARSASRMLRGMGPRLRPRACTYLMRQIDSGLSSGFQNREFV